MKKFVRSAVVVSVLGLAVSACGDAPDENEESSGGEKFEACMVLDVGGVDDKSFNQSAYQGMEEAAEENPDIEISYLASQGDADYAPNLANSVSKGCDAIISVGGLLSDATATAASENPDAQFAIVDAPSGADNVYGITFKSEQGGFLAGYVAASLSETGKVGTWGGINVGTPVTAYMDGFQQGAEYYGEQKGSPIEVLGWNGKDGAFANSFTDTAAGASTTQALVQQGADVIFPVAGGAGGGAFDVAQDEGGAVKVIWVDFPGCDYYPDDCQYIPTSALKAIPANVKDYLLKSADGDVPTGTYEGTLENDGVGIDDFNDFDSVITDETKSELDDIREQIISGDIAITVNGG
ncbi:BMP family ABC transporter substrate-binding protein [Nocardioides sp. C4-1]|uniref:BMP family lipoprotein n=1 Tax=Nocardioides sp. C4-1 TaxID=3151851 RepID=UPI003265CF31